MICMLGFICEACSGAEGTYETKKVDLTEKLTRAQMDVTEGVKGFSYDFIREMEILCNGTEESKKENYLHSPFGAAAVLAMCAEGAGGETLKEFTGAFGIEPSQMGDLNSTFAFLMEALTSRQLGNVLNTRGAAFAQEDKFLPDFVSKIKAYRANTYNFADPKMMAKFEKDFSDMGDLEMEKNLIEDFKFSLFCLMNSMWFRGKWEKPFDKANTKPDVFNNSDGTESTVPFMHLTRKFRYIDNGDFAVFRIPMKNDQFFMDIFLPAEGTGFDSVFSWIDQHKNENLLAHAEMAELILSMPKFHIESKLACLGTLPRLGITRALDHETSELRGLLTDENPHINTMIIQGAMSVDEEGTEIKVVTAIGDLMAGPPLQPIAVTLDHPFFFTVTEESTGLPMFAGKINKL